MSSQPNRQQLLSSREKFIISANRGKIITNKCLKCGHIMLGTIYYCEKCHGSDLQSIELEGTGKVVTYTIQAVAPEGFNDIGKPYAWVVFKIDNTALKVSGILIGIKSPADLPLGSKVKVERFDVKYGLELQKLSQ
ncbi:MAG: nucleotide-binding protein [Nitrososphaeraceae archaeon]|nr:nucleotide-binding protein [Nitrososphaeraceae archaeon]